MRRFFLTEAKLSEAKDDMQALINFAGKEMADRFLAIKHKLKTPENDLYYWIKKDDIIDFADAIAKAEKTKSSTQLRREAKEGAELAHKSEHWKVYRITTFAASQYYGRFTKWCITGVNNYGDTYWDRYTNDDGVEFYFVIKNGTIDPNGREDKFAIALMADDSRYEVYDQKDNRVELSAIPYIDEIDIPGVDFDDLNSYEFYCMDCGEGLLEDEICTNADGDVYCADCFSNYCAFCAGCDDIVVQDDALMAFGEFYCADCYNERFVECERCGEVMGEMNAWYTDEGIYCPDCHSELFVECFECGDELLETDAEVIDGEFYCEDCAEELNEEADEE